MRPPHETLLLGLSEQEYNLWRHNPLTSAYLSYLADLIEAYRQDALVLLEERRINPQAEFMAGQISALRELHTLKLEHIHNFYRNEETEQSVATSSD